MSITSVGNVVAVHKLEIGFGKGGEGKGESEKGDKSNAIKISPN